MAKSFTVNLGGDPASFFEKARRVAQANNATLSGDTASGTFSGSGVKGTYKRDGQTLTITITDKPFYAPWSTVESKVKQFFA